MLVFHLIQRLSKWTRLTSTHKKRKPRWGSKDWCTHMRRKFAQRERHGERVTDREGLIDYIEKKGPAKR
jgi:hypothetical protein